MNVTTEYVCGKLGIAALNAMQETMLEACGEEQRVLLLSPTGSGKTLAYLLPLVQRLEAENDAVQAVVLVPSRELALQSEDVFKALRLPLRSMSLYGGRPTMEEHRRIREVRPQLLFVTPGRLLDHLRKENVSLQGVQVFAIDEFDKCLELGFSKDMEQIAAYIPAGAQRLFTSATDISERDAFKAVCPGQNRRAFCTLDFTADEAEDDRLDVSFVRSPRKDKLETLGRLLTEIGGKPTIIFVGYRESVDRIADWLKKEGFWASAYHGGMDQEWRERALYKFRSGCVNILVSTDLASRGLDMPETACIVHYHLPATEEAYIHRCGRSTRWEGRGHAFLLLGPEETMPEFVDCTDELSAEHLESLQIVPARPRWCTLYIGRGKKEKLSKGDIVGLLCKKGGLKQDEIGRIDVKDHHAYVAVLRTKIKGLLANIKGEKIKGMKTLIEEMKN